MFVVRGHLHDADVGVRALVARVLLVRHVEGDVWTTTSSSTEPAFTRFFTELRSFVGAPLAEQTSTGKLAGPNRREAELLELMAQGLETAQIAARLERSEKTVRNSVSALFVRLDVENRPQAIVLAREAGFGRGR